ncbi:hypothetical protein K466DRAFT_570824, partial [Polyporus arcularius HHB13444]
MARQLSAIGLIVEALCPPERVRKKYLHNCSLGAKHGMQAGYGKGRLESLGWIHEWCERTCEWHRRRLPAEAQLGPLERYKLMKELLKLTTLPHGYDHPLASQPAHGVR